MGLMDIAREDLKGLMEDLDLFGVSITLRSPDAKTAAIVGRHIKHHQKLDNNTGIVKNALNASIAVSQATLAAITPAYPYLNNDQASQHYQKVDLRNHLATVADSSGASRTYKITDNIPDMSLGLIVLILTPYSE